MIERVETERLLLRALSSDDVDDLIALDGDPEVMRHLTGGRPTPRAEMETIVRETHSHRWVAFTREDHDFVGWFAPRPSGDAEYELGYRLRREAWGKGLASEASRALIEVAFTTVGARRVWAQTMAVNTQSRRVMERLGLRYVRTFHLECEDPIEGSEFGEVECELLRRDWRAATTDDRSGLSIEP
ncbi:MAG: hypothetical protein QOC92_4880 [Acidimicrobiaceae bacterium]|jgi:RimJ/RimL family protein N-acetyltransferase